MATAADAPAFAFTPADAVEALGRLGDAQLASWARWANESYWSCVSDGGEDAACRVAAKATATDRCQDGYCYAAKSPVPEGAKVAMFAGGWVERRDNSQAIRGVEIFRVGTWNGEKYTSKDLDNMIEAFDEVGFIPPVKLGHTDAPDAPAYGWVKNLRREGDILKADFEDIPDATFTEISEGRYDAVSSEIFFNMSWNDKKFPKVLAAVAILGAHPPAVSDLKSLRSSMAGLAQAAAASRHVHSIPKGAARMADPNTNPAPANGGEDVAALKAQLAEAQARVHTLEQGSQAAGDEAVRIARLSEEVETLKRQTAESQERARLAEVKGKAERVKVPSLRSHFTALYDLASRAAGAVKLVKFSVDGADKDTDPMAVIDDLAERVSKLTQGILREHGAGPVLGDREATDEAPDAEVDRLVKKLQADGKAKSYGEGMRAVLANPDNADLARRYAARGAH